jgi:hypothetical protein
MNSILNDVPSNPRVASQQERLAMSMVISKHDNAKQARDYPTLLDTFYAGAICELKPAGLRITSLNTLAEMYRRTLPRLSASFLARRKAREWSNQNGLLREWIYPVKSPSGKEVLTRQLEVFEFADGLNLIARYRVRMNSVYSDMFVEALGKDFVSLPGVERVPG